MVIVHISKLELEKWTAEVGLDINDPIADQYKIMQANDALSLVMCSSKPYSGWLAKHVEALYLPSRSMEFRYTMMIDDATVACAQVAETDTKTTDAEGWTYDHSAQWEMVKAAPQWMFQIDKYIENPDGSWKWTWTDTEVLIDPPDPYDSVKYAIQYLFDYGKKMSAIPGVTVDGKHYEFAEPLWIPAKQVGWAPGEIVTQLQQCNNAQPGGYTLRFDEIGYELYGPVA